MKIKQTLFAASFALIATLCFYPSSGHAALTVCGNDANEYQAAQNVNNSGGSAASVSSFESNSCQISDLVRGTDRITNYLITAAGLYFVFRLVWIGFMMVINAGNPDVIKEKKKDLANAFIGFIIILLAFLLINTLYSAFEVKIGGQSGFQYNFFGTS